MTNDILLHGSTGVVLGYLNGGNIWYQHAGSIMTFYE
jgi:hypothetical protein